MNALPRRSLIILTDMGLSLLFLLLLLIASIDFQHRLQQDEQQSSLRQQSDSTLASQQALQDQNQRLNDELQKKEQQTQTLLSDNLALLDQNSSLLVQLSPEQKTTPPPASTAKPERLSTTPLSAEQQQLLHNQQTLQRLQQQSPSKAPAPPTSQPASAAENDYWQKMVNNHQDPPTIPPIPAEMFILPAETPPSATQNQTGLASSGNGGDAGKNGGNGETFWEDMLSFFQGGGQAEKGSPRNKNSADTANSANIAAPPATLQQPVVSHNVIPESRQESTGRLLRQLQADLQQKQIQAEIDFNAALLTLPGLLDFSAEDNDPDPKRLPIMQHLATILMQRLRCFTGNSAPESHCPAANATTPVLDSVIVTAFSGSAALGSGAFRYHWNQASSRAAQFYAELLAADANLSQWRNQQGELLLRLDGSFSVEKLGNNSHDTPQRQVAIRLLWQ
ncbi:hypothetical protein [Candidatus Magnetaquicoccus inordinatus]|uniref:hypothetical protein n=1 Tax=Candidatus Magnetaquicoccus inordinatus TaxID=2496818 RepID=UPI00102CEB96|nr:hypothetical protein [Candidatus Magnetaquicoccus inordinatus]